MKLIRTAIADGDIERALGQTLDLFGFDQFRIYTALIADALEFIAADPLRPSSRDRVDLAPRLRSFHLSVASGRVHGASHVVFYLVPEADADTIYAIRILHQSMEPAARVVEGLKGIERT